MENIPTNVKQLVDRILELFPTHRKFMTAALAQLRDEDFAGLEDYMAYCSKYDISTDYLAKSYLVLVVDTLKEEAYFRTHKKYRYSTFEEVANDVYFNDEYMSQYMHGMAISQFFWPNHRAMYHFLQRTIPKDKPGRYLEIGPGHGLFFKMAMRDTSYDHFLGVDISATSVAQTHRILKHYLHKDRVKPYDVIEADFLHSQLPDSSYDAIIMGEVLEHVEQPDLFMKRIHDVASDDAYIFITTCIDAPVIDHIYLFESTEQIETLFNECGLSIVEELFLPYKDKSLEESLAERLPISVAYVLKKS